MSFLSLVDLLVLDPQSGSPGRRAQGSEVPESRQAVEISSLWKQHTCRRVWTLEPEGAGLTPDSPKISCMAQTRDIIF